MDDDDDYTAILKKQLAEKGYKAASAAWKANDWDSASIPNGGGDASSWKPLDWSKISVPVDGRNSITASQIQYTGNLPGELLDLTLKHDLNYLMSSGSSPHIMELAIKKEMAMKLAEKMMDDGHIIFTKQTDMADNSMRYKAYTWVGNKDFIEQQRKNKR